MLIRTMAIAQARDEAYAKLFDTERFEAFPEAPDDTGARGPTVEVRRYTTKAVSSAPECDIWVTSGMSDVVMNDDDGRPLRRELIFYAPVGANYVAGLRAIGRLPFDERTYLDHGHTVQILGSFFVPDGAKALATSGPEAVTLPHVFLGMTLLMRHRRLESELIVDGVPTEFMWVIPISAAEWALKKAKGTAALLALFEQHDLPWLFDPNRTSYVP